MISIFRSSPGKGSDGNGPRGGHVTVEPKTGEAERICKIRHLQEISIIFLYSLEGAHKGGGKRILLGGVPLEKYCTHQVYHPNYWV